MNSSQNTKPESLTAYLETSYLMNILQIWSCAISEFNTLQTAKTDVYSALYIDVVFTKILNYNTIKKQIYEKEEKKKEERKKGMKEGKLFDLYPLFYKAYIM